MVHTVYCPGVIYYITRLSLFSYENVFTHYLVIVINLISVYSHFVSVKVFMFFYLCCLYFPEVDRVNLWRKTFVFL